MKYQKFILIILILSVLIGAGIFIYDKWWSSNKITIHNKAAESKESSSIEIIENQPESKTIVFVGDIMLDRGVEYLMKKNSFLYPFEKINEFLKDFDIVFGNLEGPINKNPQYFPDKSLMFSFSAEIIKGLSFANFNLLSLANNHTLNMSQEGLEETRELLEENKIDFVGEPILCNQDFSFEKENIIFLAFNKAPNSYCKNEEIIETIESVKSENPEKFLIVSIHWGREHELTNSFFQYELAHQMIDAGADLIIGHHPHVVQNIEIYKEKLIFYSLGNFVFDQYFSEEAQQGLAIGLEVYPKKLVYQISPIQSRLTQPFLMEEKEKNDFLNALAQRSNEELAEEIKKGIIEIER